MEFDLQGNYFNYVPDDAIAIISYENDNPLEYLDDTGLSHYLVLSDKTDNSMKATGNGSYSFPRNVYLGALVSADRSEIYWVNETKPLP